MNRRLLAFLHGNRAWDIELYDRTVADLRIAGGAGISMIVMTDYAGWLIALERLPQARHLLHEALCHARRTPTSWPVAGILICLALADALEGATIAAASKLGAVEGVRTSRGVTVPLQFQQRIDQATVVARGAIEQFAFAEAFDQGRLNANDIVNHLLADPLEPGLDDVQQ